MSLLSRHLVAADAIFIARLMVLYDKHCGHSHCAEATGASFIYPVGNCSAHPWVYRSNGDDASDGFCGSHVHQTASFRFCFPELKPST